jgi:hypothetical protein
MYCQEDSLPQSRTPFLCILLWLVKLGEMSWETTGPVKNRLGEHGSQEISHRNELCSLRTCNIPGLFSKILRLLIVLLLDLAIIIFTSGS